MSNEEAVLDASAFLAFLQGEPGADAVEEALARGCCMSAVNWAEVLSKVADLGRSSHELVSELRRHQLLGVSLRVIPFEEDDGPDVGELRPQTRRQGLSLGDRACLCLGRRFGSPVLTTDRAWGELGIDLGVEIRMIR